LDLAQSWYVLCYSVVSFFFYFFLYPATHRRKNKYGLKTFDEANRAALPSTPSTWFILLSVICFGAPLDQRKHINAAKRSSDLRGDLETWPAYVEQLVREWSTFNLAVRYPS
jgi:hypothetical protein